MLVQGSRLEPPPTKATAVTFVCAGPPPQCLATAAARLRRRQQLLGPVCWNRDNQCPVVLRPMLGPSPVVQTGPSPVVVGREARDLWSLTGTRQYGTAPPAASILSASMPRFAPPVLRHRAYEPAPLTTAGLRSGTSVRSTLRLVEDSSPPLRLPYVWSLRPASGRRHSSAASSLRASLRRDASMRPAFQTNAEHPARRLALSRTHRIPVAPQSLRSQRSAIASVLTDLPVPAQRPRLAAAARRHRAAKSGGHPARQGTATLSCQSVGYLLPHIGTGHLWPLHTFGRYISVPYTFDRSLSEPESLGLRPKRPLTP